NIPASYIKSEKPGIKAGAVMPIGYNSWSDALITQRKTFGEVESLILYDPGLKENQIVQGESLSGYFDKLIPNTKNLAVYDMPPKIEEKHRAFFFFNELNKYLGIPSFTNKENPTDGLWGYEYLEKQDLSKYKSEEYPAVDAKKVWNWAKEAAEFPQEGYNIIRSIHEISEKLINSKLLKEAINKMLSNFLTSEKKL